MNDTKFSYPSFKDTQESLIIPIYYQPFEDLGQPTYVRKTIYTTSSVFPGWENRIVNDQGVTPLLELTKALQKYKVITLAAKPILRPMWQVYPENRNGTGNLGVIKHYEFTVELSKNWTHELLRLALWEGYYKYFENQDPKKDMSSLMIYYIQEPSPKKLYCADLKREIQQLKEKKPESKTLD